MNKGDGQAAAWNADTQLDGNSVIYLEEMYERYLEEPDSVPASWQQYFDELPQVNGHGRDARHSQVKDYFRAYAAKPQAFVAASSGGSVDLEHERKQVKVLQLINAYRVQGHFHARTNPLDENAPRFVKELTLEYHSLTEQDLDVAFNTGSLFTADQMKLRDIISLLEATYCGSIGAQYMHTTSTEQKRWIQQRLESIRATPSFNKEEKIDILDRLTVAEGLERYLHTNYVGQKRFSLEGGESLIPMLNSMILHAGKKGAVEMVIGMAHRGRLNVLVNILGKSPAMLFSEFEGKYADTGRTGDVKYHMGYASDLKTEGGPVHVAMAFNPSHLEIVGPVVEGAVRARQDRWAENGYEKIVPVVLHGDAAFAGQGVNMEMMQMADTRGYRTHGTMHIVINNQVGFTTSASIDARSTYYCTDIAKMVDSPVFHVNGDDPEAVVMVTQLALDYRNHFKKDVVIDLVCYRRHGHNEADEPSATQPVMYRKIRSLPTTRERYAQKLAAEGIITEEDAKMLVQRCRQQLTDGIPTVPHLLGKDEVQNPHPVNWKRYVDGSWDMPVDTTIDEETIQRLGEKLTIVPEGFKLNSRVARIVTDRKRMAAGEQPMDWGFCENLAYATLVEEGFPIRLSGEDCGRGTFFHRHAVFHEQETGETYVPLKNLSPAQLPFVVIDSLLSEEAVLGFEYGYATTEANTLTIWEAQFGDFANCAQVVIDQFISSGEQKWGRLCGLVMLLPHGFEGQGPEHSSARLERYLQLCAQNNMQVCVPSTPAQAFHMLRRQMLRDYRTPLIVMTPKSLLRHPMAVNTLEDLTERGFQNIISEIDPLEAEKVTRLVMCSGKVYYDLLEARRKAALEHVAIVRIEQLYPFPEVDMCTILRHYPNAEEHVWCQEEPLNQGAWLSIQPSLRAVLGSMAHLEVASRPASASPAVGSSKVHAAQQQALVNAALGIIAES
ncbi:2-oxoglutarate dehydrogenase E1 component [Candidatus Thiothrix sp. Deng01]|uniref:oxoglutarate dehydrogenase (succinyl-transferring) n=1 Tax=Candidatus Thiothrix phosphatis TaxID=3112415 RepID=A0ABU6CZ84_9GAMM|nr:2-oxoglutarate dehydrogenase E1 component [Candidatus Thiothrix sp. Deng01]MEB4591876.1 2-oxoglutarate dehydrogenase E1 component [Candidatus Thiothrix sp. Deng01]